MKKILILLGLAFPFQGYASPPTVMKQLNRVPWKTDHLSVDEAVQADEKGAMQDIVQGLNLLSTDVRESVIDPMLPTPYEPVHSYPGWFLSRHFDIKRPGPRSLEIKGSFPAYLGVLPLGIKGCVDIAKIGWNKESFSSSNMLVPLCCVTAALCLPLYSQDFVKDSGSFNPFTHHIQQVRNIRVSLDGKFFITSSRDKELLWEVDSHKCLGRANQELEQEFSRLFAHNGYELTLVRGTGRLLVREMNGPFFQTLEAPYPITTASFTRDGKKIIAGR